MSDEAARTAAECYDFAPDPAELSLMANHTALFGEFVQETGEADRGLYNVIWRGMTLRVVFDRAAGRIVSFLPPKTFAEKFAERTGHLPFAGAQEPKPDAGQFPGPGPRPPVPRASVTKAPAPRGIPPGTRDPSGSQDEEDPPTLGFETLPSGAELVDVKITYPAAVPAVPAIEPELLPAETDPLSPYYPGPVDIQDSFGYSETGSPAIEAGGNTTKEERTVGDEKERTALEVTTERPGGELQEVPAIRGSVVDLSAFKARLDNMLGIRKLILDQLIEGVHYGTEKGISKPFLHQPGGALVLHCYELSPRYRGRETEWFEYRDPQSGQMMPQVRCRVYCLLVRWITEEPVYEGMIRECSSMEKQFLERQFDRTIYSYKWKKNFDIKADPVQAFAGDVMRQAQKRAMVDAARMFSGLDDRFTQDAELVPGETEPGTGPDANGKGAPSKAAGPGNGRVETKAAEDRPTDGEYDTLRTIGQNLNPKKGIGALAREAGFSMPITGTQARQIVDKYASAEAPAQ